MSRQSQRQGVKSGQKNSSFSLNKEQGPAGESIMHPQAVLVPFGLEREVSNLVPAPARWLSLAAPAPSLPPSLSHAGSATSISWLTSGCTRKSRARQQHSSADSGRSLSLSGFVCFLHRSCSG